MSDYTPVEEQERLQSYIRNWITMEENLIDYSSELLKEAENPFIKCICEFMVRDSEKHKILLETILNQLLGTVTFTHDDMKLLDKFLDKHADIEKNAVEHAEQTVADCKQYLPKMLLRYLAEDERKHDLLLSELDRLKSKAMIGN